MTEFERKQLELLERIADALDHIEDNTWDIKDFIDFLWEKTPHLIWRIVEDYYNINIKI